jgi:hypothetical protein
MVSPVAALVQLVALENLQLVHLHIRLRIPSLAFHPVAVDCIPLD